MFMLINEDNYNAKLTNFLQNHLVVYVYVIIVISANNIIKSYLNLIVVLLLLLSITIIALKQKINKKYLLITVLIALFLVLNIFVSIDQRVTLRFVEYYGIAIIFFLCDFDAAFFKKTSKLLYTAALVFSLVTIVCFFYPNFILIYFSNFILYLQDVQFEVSHQVYSGLAGEVSMNAFIISIGIAYLFSKMLVFGEKKTLSILLIIMMYFSIILTAKRSFFLIIPIAIILLIYMYNKKYRILKLGLLAVLFSGLFLVSTNYLPRTFLFLEKFNSEDPLNSRVTIWQYAFDAFNTHAFLGIGIGSFPEYCVQNGYALYSGVHNIYLQVLCECGLLGVLVITPIIILSLFATLKMLKKLQNMQNNDQTKNDLVLLTFSLMVQVVFLLYGISGNPLFVYHQFYMYVFALAIVKCYTVQYKTDVFKII